MERATPKDDAYSLPAVDRSLEGKSSIERQPMTNFMTALKPAWHLEKIAALRAGRNIVPTHLQLIISDLCNQDCHFCAYRMDTGFSVEQFPADGRHNPIRFIPTDKCHEILADYADMGGKAVEFTGGGEPTVHAGHLDIIGFAQARGLQTGLVTNGTRIKDHPVFHALDWLRISLDAGTEETYRRTRKSDAWARVMRNLRVAASLTKPKVGVGYVVTRENATEIEQAAILVRDAGIPYMRVSAMFSTEGAAYYDGLTVVVPRVEGFQIVDCFADRVADLEQGPPDYVFCGQQQFSLYIGGNQKIYTCCTNAYTKHGEIGDLTTTTFKQWMRLMDQRRDWDSRTCHHCQFNEKNRLINYLLQPKPEHVDFV
jgi:MoaA/NifB/PqqE/SkfB family radical SAM enzyme